MIDNVCSIRISGLNESHAGVWKVTAYTKREEIKENVILYDIIPEVFLFKLYIHEEKQVLPSQYVDMYNMYDGYRRYERREMQYVNVYDGRYVYIKYNENYKNLKTCNLTGPVINSTNLLTEKRDDFQLFGQCGVRMKVNDTFKGSWKLDAIINDYVSYYISFYVHVHQKKEKANLNNMLVIQWTRGSPGIIELSNRVSDQSKICQIVDPNGIIVTALFGKCYHRVEVATIAHKGVWLARYNVYGMLEPIEEEFRIEVSPEPFIFNANVTHTKNDSATLVCRLEMKQYSDDRQYSNRQKSCNFVRPDGMTFYLMPGIGTERYIAYINSTVEQPKYGRKLWNKTMKCAITIRKLEDVDYGAWRCYLKTHFSDNLYGSMLYVDYPDSRGNINPKNKTDIVHVKRDDPFTINCVADSVLKYCWLRSPNGTSYLVARNNEAVSSSVLHYQSNGFTYGECKAEISAAVDSDYGQWTCFMGVADGNEISMSVLVIVTETYLVAEQTEIAVSPRNDPVLSCHILPRMLDRPVHYCRWIRPDGYGIYNDISHRYTTNSSYSQCRLVILEYRPEEDNGNWTCVAGLMGKNDQVQEAWDHINVYEISLNTSEISSSLNTSEIYSSLNTSEIYSSLNTSELLASH
ncbi:hypothetical protein P5V15_009604 [Pogonomyrmex californicus]